LLEARAAYSDAVRLTGNDPVLISKLGYTEVRLGRTEEGITRLQQAAEKAPEVVEIRERLMRAFVALNTLPDLSQTPPTRRTNWRFSKAPPKRIFALPAFEFMPINRSRRVRSSNVGSHSFPIPRNSAEPSPNSAPKPCAERSTQTV